MFSKNENLIGDSGKNEYLKKNLKKVCVYIKAMNLLILMFLNNKNNCN